MNLLDIVGLSVSLKREGPVLKGLCPWHGERTPSFTVFEAKQSWYCFGCGAWGDAIDFIQRLHGSTQREAIAWLLGRADSGEKPTARAPVLVVDDAARAALVQRLWHEALPAPGTVVEAYLRSRGIPGPVPVTLRYQPPGKRVAYPAILAAVQGPQGGITGLHRTFLTTDGSGKAPIDANKRMLGKCHGGAVRLGLVGAALWVAEGIETALSVRTLMRTDAVWAALSTSGLRALALPARVTDVTICADHDAPGLAAARDAWRRWAGEGRRVRLALPATAGADWNDELVKKVGGRA